MLLNLPDITSIENFEAKASRHRANSAAQTSFSRPGALSQPPSDASQIDGLYHPLPLFPTHEGFHSSVARFDSPEFGNFEFTFPYQTPSMNTSAPTLHFVGSTKPTTPRSMTAPARRRLLWAPECAVYSTYDAGTYDRRSEPATCNRLTPQLALAIKQEYVIYDAVPVIPG
jgi:hypothetical protein